jgi:hypothetical protein
MNQGHTPNFPPAEAPDTEPYACFLQRKDQIAAWLRTGYSVKGAWIACQRAKPSFDASYQTFWRYCRRHSLSTPRGVPPTTPPESSKAADGVSTRSGVHGASGKVWPRVGGKPREFIPRVEE